MAGPTLADLRTAFYNRFDEGAQNYITVSEANTLVNEGAAHLYNWLISSGEDYVWKEVLGQLSQTQTDFALPADFYKALKVFTITNGLYNPMPRLMLDEYRGIGGPYGYFIIDGYLRTSQCLLYPTTTVSLWYVPQFTKLVADTDSFNFNMIPGWEEFVINQAVIGARIKEESDTSSLERRQAQIIQLIETDMANRDMGRHQHVIDAERRNWYYA